MKIKELFLTEITEASSRVEILRSDIKSLTEYQFPNKVSSVRIMNCDNLTDLKGFPEKLTGTYISIGRCKNLKSLEGLPNLKDKEIYIEELPIVNLKNLPTSARALAVYDCDLLSSLEGIPTVITNEFRSRNLPKITNLKNIEKMIKSCPGKFYIPFHVKSHILGLLQIPDLKQIFVSQNEETTDLSRAAKTLSTYAKSATRNVWRCQDELQDADLDEYAQL